MALSMEVQVRCIGAAALLFPLVCCSQVELGSLSFVSGSLLSAFTVACLALATCMFDISRRRPAKSHTWSTLLFDYVRYVAGPILYGSWAAVKNYENVLADCRLHQEAALRSIIEANKDTVYGQEHGIGFITSREDLVASQPLSTYDRYQPYVDRILEGEDNVLIAAKVEFIGLTSGTTGKNKAYPVSTLAYKNHAKLYLATYLRHWDFYASHGLARRFEFRLFFPPKLSPTGIPMGGVGALVLTHNKSDVTPKSYRQLKMEKSIFYSQAIFALAEREVGYIDGFSSDVFLAFWDFMIANKEQLCTDIEQGVITPCGDLEGSVLHDLNTHLRKDPERAAELRLAFQGTSVGLARRLWPRLSAVACAKTGSFAHTARILMDTYVKGVPLNFFTHGGSEGWYGIQFEDNWHSEVFTLMPLVTFMEFIDTEHLDEDNPRTYFMDQLEVGRSYEVVVTNTSGLYRYRMGDVITVTGYRGNTPQYIFSHRTGQVLNIAFERTPETALLAAIGDVQSMLGEAAIIEAYTVTESFHLSKVTGKTYTTPCYVFFLELTNEGEPLILDEEQKSQFEEALLRAHETYGDFRRQGSVGPVEVVQVASGTFHELRNVLTVPSMQFKMPRVLRKPEGLQVLWDKRLS